MKVVSPRSSSSFYGWWIVILASLTGALTAPGQSIGVAVFRNPMTHSLGLTDTSFSITYTCGTLVASFILPFIGRWIDKVGVRFAATVIGGVFAFSILHMSTINGVIFLTLGFLAIRLFGQGALSLVSSVAVVHWFEQRRGTALGVTMTLTTGGMSVLPVLFAIAIEEWGWRTAWVVISVFVIAIVVPVAWFGFVNTPGDINQKVDGLSTSSTNLLKEDISVKHKEAIVSKPFAILAACTFLNSLLVTGMTFHQTSILGEIGYSQSRSAIMFIPVALGSISGGFLFGWLADKKLRTYLPAQVMFLVALASLLAGLADSIPTVVLYSFLLGTCYGGCSATNGALIPWLFGVVEVAAIAGTLSFVTVFSSSFGPFIFSLGDEVFGSYRSASIIFSIFPILLGIFVTIVKPHRISCLYKDSDGG